jgi:[acyl-carrier-protein] S-malonyltransferase
MATAVTFPGQGSQFVGMADAWTTHPAGQAVLDEASEALGRSVVDGARDEAALATTSFVQPALLACDVAAFRVLQAEGLGAPVGVAGHSLGEFAALVAAEAIGLAEALELVVVRGEAMQRAGEERPGAMTALLGVGGDDAEALCAEARADAEDGDELVVANRNSPAQSVASGSIPAIERLEALAKERKVRAVRLPVAGAFHSALMEPAVQPVLDTLDQADIRAPKFPVAENVTGELVTDAERLGRQVVSPVAWETGVRSLIAAGASAFIEAGVGDVLTKLMKRIDPSVAAIAVDSADAAREAITALPR